MMNRRRFLQAVSVSLLAVPIGAEAQPAGKIARIGITVATDVFHDAFLQGLREAGWVQGQNIVVERRTSRGERERIAAIAAELVALKLDAIVVASPLAIAAFKQATSTIPIVGLDLESDPVSSGFMASLARPGANVTGIFLDMPELGGKQIQFLRDTVRGLARVAVLYERETGEPQLRATEEAARGAEITVQALGVRRADEIRPALERVARERVQALVVLTSPLLSNNRRQIVELTRKYRLPTISPFIVFADAGALMAYGPSQPEMFRRAAGYVDKILRGTKAGELPVERPSKFELIINLKTAKALGLIIPPSVLGRADHIIE